MDAAAFCIRIDVYKHAGDFEPHQADGLKALGWRSDVQHPPAMVREFVRRYGRNRVGAATG